ncbi:hypothetical protein [Actinoallomurus iriomotensis]|uniref:Uncharacterized protein n=1 Tax=Actinoallomurus iriomotensis TaxID=478107 RepID=A0A9W6RPH3_9ACTN|nr:hypothetical protein [Actinoallomurus iriomotensis]GLY79229.1 hypothetical protein Airi01_074960 [Actinoallomurus iriomotensis]
MGVDWYRMRIRGGADRDELHRLIHEQAELAWPVHFHLAGPPERPEQPGWWDDEGFPGRIQPGGDTRQRYGRVVAALDERLHVAGTDSWSKDIDWDGFPGSWRFSALGLHPLLPPEWRADALRTWLPEELPRQRWSEHLEAVRSGRHRPYLLARYLHDVSARVRHGWDVLVGTAEATRERTNAWASKPALVELREHLAALPEPAVRPAPRWSEWKDRHGEADPARAPAYEEIHRADELRVRLTRVLDANLPGNRKIRHYQPIPSFQEFLAEADDPWRSGLLQWIERCCEEEQGVFLW